MTNNQPLFRLTTKRKELLNDIITFSTYRVERVNEESFARLTALAYPNEQAKQTRLSKIDEQLKKWTLYHDVLETISTHTFYEEMRDFFKLEHKEWITEWDIPLALFNETMDEVEKELTEVCNGSPEKLQIEYRERIQFIRELKAFRNKVYA